MSWWGERSKPTKDNSPVPVVPAPEIPRDQVLLAQLRAIDAELATLENEARDLRQRHGLQVNRFCQITGMRSDSLNGFASVDREWRILRKRIDCLFPRRNAILKEWSGLRVPHG